MPRKIITSFFSDLQLKTCFALIFIINVAACVFTAPYAYHVELARVSDSEDSVSARYVKWDTSDCYHQQLIMNLGTAFKPCHDWR